MNVFECIQRICKCTQCIKKTYLFASGANGVNGVLFGLSVFSSGLLMFRDGAICWCFVRGVQWCFVLFAFVCGLVAFRSLQREIRFPLVVYFRGACRRFVL